MNFRDFHKMTTDHIFDIKQKIDKTKVRLEKLTYPPEIKILEEKNQKDWYSFLCDKE